MTTTINVLTVGTILEDTQDKNRSFVVVHIKKDSESWPVQICATDGSGFLMWIGENQLRSDGYIVVSN